MSVVLVSRGSAAFSALLSCGLCVPPRTSWHALCLACGQAPNPADHFSCIPSMSGVEIPFPLAPTFLRLSLHLPALVLLFSGINFQGASSFTAPSLEGDIPRLMYGARCTARPQASPIDQDAITPHLSKALRAVPVATFQVWPVPFSPLFRKLRMRLPNPVPKITDFTATAKFLLHMKGY